jgi:predicted  nucleic acid-binding Zn-ribbon protein
MAKEKSTITSMFPFTLIVIAIIIVITTVARMPIVNNAKVKRNVEIAKIEYITIKEERNNLKVEVDSLKTEIVSLEEEIVILEEAKNTYGISGDFDDLIKKQREELRKKDAQIKRLYSEKDNLFNKLDSLYDIFDIVEFKESVTN